MSSPTKNPSDKSHFKVISTINLDEVKLDDVIPESDFCTITPQGKFVQLEHVEGKTEKRKVTVTPGIWKINETNQGLKLAETEFSKEDILQSFVHTKKITEAIDRFFNRLHIYKEHGIEVPKRSILLYGNAGGGKSSSIRIVAEKYAKKNDTAILLWSTDVVEPHSVKEFIKMFVYEGVSNLILVAEDIGGVEVDEVKVQSDSSLLALLDNSEKSFSIPTLILATTNFPEIFLGNLTNRPGRIDVKIEVQNPNGEERTSLLTFFLKSKMTEAIAEKISLKKYDDFSVAHLKEVAIRSAIEEITIADSIDQIAAEIKQYKELFRKRNSLGIKSND